jgi:hypothetical protein
VSGLAQSTVNCRFYAQTDCSARILHGVPKPAQWPSTYQSIKKSSKSQFQTAGRPPFPQPSRGVANRIPAKRLTNSVKTIRMDFRLNLAVWGAVSMATTRRDSGRFAQTGQAIGSSSAALGIRAASPGKVAPESPRASNRATTNSAVETIPMREWLRLRRISSSQGI